VADTTGPVATIAAATATDELPRLSANAAAPDTIEKSPGQSLAGAVSTGGDTSMVRATRGFRLIRTLLLVAALPLAGWAVGLIAQDAAQPQRAFTLTASKYRFDPPRLEVDQNDLVKITLKSADIAHSFTVDGYRIAKRAGPGQTVTFEFRADQPGTFRFYCNLKQDERCKEMQGELVVHPK
jgi:plastocyanin